MEKKPQYFIYMLQSSNVLHVFVKYLLPFIG